MGLASGICRPWATGRSSCWVRAYSASRMTVPQRRGVPTPCSRAAAAGSDGGEAPAGIIPAGGAGTEKSETPQEVLAHCGPVMARVTARAGIAATTCNSPGRPSSQLRRHRPRRRSCRLRRSTDSEVREAKLVPRCAACHRQGEHDEPEGIRACR